LGRRKNDKAVNTSADEDRDMASGSVKWFNNTKGYGFIRPDTGGDDLFVHYSYIQTEGYKSLKAGQFVQFDIQASGNGFHAINLRPLSESHNDAMSTAEETLATSSVVQASP
jgi:CspA family cold shock protein